MNTSSTALVLGGGGSTGNAWLIGIVAGLFDAGIDVTHADLTVGTSAGSTAAAQLAGASPAELLAASVAPIPQQARLGPPANGPVDDHLERLTSIIAESADAADWHHRMSTAAVDADSASDGTWSAQWRDIVASRLPGARWPERSVVITAVDARRAEPASFDRDSGVDIVDAVAASCAGGALPYRIGDDLYIDGGYRANAENADLAAGCDRVLVLSPLGGRSLTPPAWGTDLPAQVDGLRAGGSHVETVVPRDEDDQLFGANAMNFALRPAAAQAGYDQAHALAHRIGELWV